MRTFKWVWIFKSVQDILLNTNIHTKQFYSNYEIEMMWFCNRNSCGLIGRGQFTEHYSDWVSIGQMFVNYHKLHLRRRL